MHYYWSPWPYKELDKAIQRIFDYYRKKYSNPKSNKHGESTDPKRPSFRYPKLKPFAHRLSPVVLGLLKDTAKTALSCVQSNDVLVIGGHGAPEGKQLRRVKGDETSQFTMPALAEHLESFGLKKEIVLRIKLACCFGAGMLQGDLDWLSPEEDYTPPTGSNKGKTIKVETKVEDLGFKELVELEDYYRSVSEGAIAWELAKALDARGYGNVVVGGYQGELVKGKTTYVRYSYDLRGGSANKVFLGRDKSVLKFYNKDGETGGW